MGSVGMWDGGDHGYSAGRAYATDVGEEDMADDKRFGEDERVIWSWVSRAFAGIVIIVTYASILVD